MTDYIRYDLLAQNALRGVVRTVMTDAAKKGLLGEHHFKISFDTTAPGVKLSPRLREQYPQEMTIVLQHQFWDLEVSDEAFEVGLSFSGVPERLRVPFDAITGFFDPSVEFGLQFAIPLKDRPTSKASSLTSRSQNWCYSTMVISCGCCWRRRGDSFTPGAVVSKEILK